MIDHILKPKRQAPPMAGATSGKSVDYQDFVIPDGMELDADLDGHFRSIAKSIGLSQEDAQKLVDLYVRQLDLTRDRWTKEHEARIIEWQKRARADREIGGSQFERNTQIARKAVDRFGGDPLVEALSETGAASHPEVLRCFFRIGNALSEDGFVAHSGKRQTKSYAETFYPKHTY